jgi:hypothetical protein
MKTTTHRFFAESLLHLIALHPGLCFHPEYKNTNNSSANNKALMHVILDPIPGNPIHSTKDPCPNRPSRNPNPGKLSMSRKIEAS